MNQVGSYQHTEMTYAFAFIFRPTASHAVKQTLKVASVWTGIMRWQETNLSTF